MKLRLFTPLLAAFFLFTTHTLFGATELLFMALVLAFLPVLSLGFALLSLVGIRVSRESPAHLYEGQTGQVKLQVTNCSFLPKFFLEFSDSYPPYLGPRMPLFTPGLRPKQNMLASYTIRPEKRGLYHLGPLTLCASDPVGVITLRRRLGLADEILVYPTFPKLRKAPPSGPDKLGVSVASLPSGGGAALDFYNIRDYYPGDEFRRIHWKTTARTNALKVVEREQPSLTQTMVMLYFPPGSNPGEGNHSPLEYAIKLAAGVAWAAIETGGTFTLALPPQQGLPSQFTIKTRSQFIQLLEILARVEEPSTTVAPPVLSDVKALTRCPKNLIVFAGKVDPSLTYNLAFYRACGASIRLVTFDASSFNTSSPKSATPAYSPGFTPSPHLPLMVRNGQDLSKVLEEIILAS